MSLHKFYQAIDGDFEAACRRFYNENMLQKFLIRFLDEPCCAELNDALGRHDRDAAIKAVHTLAGQARSFGFIRLEKKSAALLQALRGNQDDVLIVRNNLLTDTSIANVALEKEGVWYTPRTPLLKGTKRALLLEQGVLTECDIPSDEISSYSHIALFNAMIDFQSLVLEINRDTVIRI